MIGVAAYCRVSTDQTDQVNSLEAQKRYFREYIAREPTWELCGIYADEGISGTERKKRTAFNRMMRDAAEGRFRIILTKEVSRFSRNILDTISCTRQLRACGVGVLFLTDGISTLEPDAELRLSIMASLAQEESRKTSVRVKWGQTRRMEQGVVFGHSLLGYRVKNGSMSVREDEAQTVRKIFRLYTEEGYSSGEIAALLNRAETPKANGESGWNSRHILRILKNEKYAGDLVQKKSCTPDYLSHARKRNCGEEKQIVLRDHHEAIVPRGLWELTQQEIRRRSTGSVGREGGTARSGLSGKICCGECGARFVRRQKRGAGGTTLYRWSCATVVRNGADGERGGCGVSRLLREDDAVSMLRQAMASLKIDRKKLAEETACIVQEAIRRGTVCEQKAVERRHLEERRLRAKKEALLEAYLGGEIGKEELQSMKRRYDAALAALKEQGNSVKCNNSTEVDGSRIAEDIGRELERLLQGEGEAALRSLSPLLKRLTVYGDGHAELTLQGLDTVFFFR